MFKTGKDVETYHENVENLKYFENGRNVENEKEYGVIWANAVKFRVTLQDPISSHALFLTTVLMIITIMMIMMMMIFSLSDDGHDDHDILPSPFLDPACTVKHKQEFIYCTASELC